jgi:hypothetical protein
VESRVPAVLILVAVLVAGCGGGNDPPAAPEPPASPGLRIDRGAAGDLTVYVDPAENVRSRAGGRSQVQLRCLDLDGGLVIAQDEGWPFAETDGGLFEPHAHVGVDPIGASSIDRCKLAGTKPLLEASAR